MELDALLSGSKVFSKSIQIQAPTSRVWEHLTNPELMKNWMLDTDLDVITDWKIGSQILIRGNMHGIRFENKGTVLQFEPERIVQYTHLSSLSKLLNSPENFTKVEFRLAAFEDQTALTITLSNFPTETIYKHLAFYWNSTLEIIKKTIENQA